MTCELAGMIPKSNMGLPVFFEVASILSNPERHLIGMTISSLWNVETAQTEDAPPIFPSVIALNS